MLYLEYAKFNGGVHIFRFRPEITVLGKFGPKMKIVSSIRNLVPRLIRIC